MKIGNYFVYFNFLFYCIFYLIVLFSVKILVYSFLKFSLNVILMIDENWIVCCNLDLLVLVYIM